MRYMHSTVETVDAADVEHASRLMTAFACSIRTDDHFSTGVLD